MGISNRNIKTGKIMYSDRFQVEKKAWNLAKKKKKLSVGINNRSIKTGKMTFQNREEKFGIYGKNKKLSVRINEK